MPKIVKTKSTPKKVIETPEGAQEVTVPTGLAYLVSDSIAGEGLLRDAYPSLKTNKTVVAQEFIAPEVTEVIESPYTLEDARAKLFLVCNQYPSFVEKFQEDVKTVLSELEWAALTGLRLFDTSNSLEAVDAFQYSFSKVLWALSELDFDKILDEIIKAKQG